MKQLPDSAIEAALSIYPQAVDDNLNDKETVVAVLEAALPPLIAQFRERLTWTLKRFFDDHELAEISKDVFGTPEVPNEKA